jgi:hypothetical protein
MGVLSTIVTRRNHRKRFPVEAACGLTASIGRPPRQLGAAWCASGVVPILGPSNGRTMTFVPEISIQLEE